MTNPLLEGSAEPSSFIELPSKGRFYDTPPKLHADDELEIRPMNALDELNFQNPDGLLNNNSLIKVLKRTVPGIENPEEILKPDLDVIIIGLRRATYGENLDVDVKCSKCGHEETRVVNLTDIIGTAKPLMEDNTATVNDLIVHLKPYTILSQTKISELNVAIQRAAMILQDRMSEAGIDTINDESVNLLKTQMSDSLAKTTLEMFNIVVNSVIKVIMPDDVVINDKNHIQEWLHSLSAPKFNIIKDKLTALNTEVIDRERKYNCSECNHENTLIVDFDPANFFAAN